MDTFRKTALALTVATMVGCVSIPMYAIDVQKLTFHHLSSENNFHSDNAYTIIQDCEGDMWFGTECGFSRFDGYNVINYDFDRNIRVINGKGYSISGLYVDLQGEVWAAFDKFYRYDRANETFKAVAWLDSVEIHDFVDIGGTALIALGDKIVSLDLKSFEKTDTPAALSELDAILFSRKGEYLYIYTDTNNIYKYCLYDGNLELLAHCRAESLTNDFLAAESIWIATNGNGLIEFDESTSVFRTYRHGNDTDGSICSNYIRGLDFDTEGNLWIATGDGLSIMDVTDRSIQSVMCDRNSIHTPSHNSLSTVFRDRDGMMWLGLALRGVNYCYPKESPFKIIDLGDYPECIVTSVKEDFDGSIWIGTTRLGAFHYWPSTGRVKQVLLSESEPIVNDIKTFFFSKDGESVYIGTGRGGLFRYDRNSGQTVQCAPDCPQKRISDIIPYKDNRMWITMNDGIYLYNPSRDRFTEVTGNSLLNSLPAGLIDEGDGHFRVAQFDTGLYGFSLSTNGDGIPEISECRICIEKTGIVSFKEYDGLTIIAMADGLYSYDGEALRKMTDRLSSEYVRSFEKDAAGHIWAGTDFGLNRLDLSTGKVSSFFVENGLPDNEFRADASLCASDGTMYFGGLGGLVRFNPSDVDISSTSYDPKVTYAVTDGKRSLLGKGGLTINPDYGSFSLYFSVQNYLSYGKDRFYYRLLPSGKEWIQAPDNYVTFSDLHHGKYTFELMSVNANGEKSEGIFSLPVRIRPHWYSSIAAKLIFITLLILLLLYLFTRIRLYLKNKMDERTEKINKAAQEDMMNNKVRLYSNRILSAEETDFLNRAITIAESHVQDKNFSIEDFASAVCMSRSNLHLRLVSTTGLSASHFLNKVRLEKSIRLLATKEYNIAQIGEMVGFSSTSYFVKLFKEYTGSTPGRLGKKS